MSKILLDTEKLLIEPLRLARQGRMEDFPPVQDDSVNLKSGRATSALISPHL